MNIMLSIDPGLDETGLAWWALDRPPQSNRYHEQLRAVDRIRTSAADGYAKRLKEISDAMTTACIQARSMGEIRAVIIERQVRGGMYDRSTKRGLAVAIQRALYGQHLAAGVLALACYQFAGEIVFLEASNTKKGVKEMIGRRAIEKAGLPPPLGKRGKAVEWSADMCDAVVVGMQALGNPDYRYLLNPAYSAGSVGGATRLRGSAAEATAE